MSQAVAVKPRRKTSRETSPIEAPESLEAPQSLEEQPPTTKRTETGIQNPEILVAVRTGMRRVRGVPARVDLPVFNVLIGGVLVAITSTEPGKPVMGVREVLPHEIGRLVDAVAEKRGDETPARFVPQPRFA
jgi:hypothetical protein